MWLSFQKCLELCDGDRSKTSQMTNVDSNRNTVPKTQDATVSLRCNIIGDSLTAEDVVQEILNACFLNDRTHIEDPDRYLMRSVINRSINARKPIKARKQQHIGQWLPVPVHTDEEIYSGIDKHQILEYSLLMLLEKLNARERAVFILKESFNFDHGEIQ